MPYELYNNFVAGCKSHPEKVQVKYDALCNARDTYKLYTEEDLLKFIGNYGLVNPVHGIEVEWGLNPDPDKKNNPLYVNDYLCLVNRAGCYIAIIYINYWFGQDNDRWILKSFKLPDPDKMDRFLPSPFKLTAYNRITEG